jgi:hypothetical protein
MLLRLNQTAPPNDWCRHMVTVQEKGVDKWRDSMWLVCER